MKGFGRRIGKLEQRFCISKEDPFLLTITVAGQHLALDSDRCIEILNECGFISPSGITVVHLRDIPKGLNASETESLLRKEGAKICGPRRS